MLITLTVKGNADAFTLVVELGVVLNATVTFLDDPDGMNHVLVLTYPRANAVMLVFVPLGAAMKALPPKQAE